MKGPRRFKAGDQIKIGWADFLVQPGTKADDDLRISWWNPYEERWDPATLDIVFLLVDFIAENEDILYPLPANGGQEVLQYCRIARVEGWQRAVAKLHEARARKATRREDRLDNSERDYWEGKAAHQERAR